MPRAGRPIDLHPPPDGGGGAPLAASSALVLLLTVMASPFGVGRPNLLTWAGEQIGGVVFSPGALWVGRGSHELAVAVTFEARAERTPVPLAEPLPLLPKRHALDSQGGEFGPVGASDQQAHPGLPVPRTLDRFEGRGRRAIHRPLSALRTYRALVRGARAPPVRPLVV